MASLSRAGPSQSIVGGRAVRDWVCGRVARHVGARELVPWKRTDEDGMRTGCKGTVGMCLQLAQGPNLKVSARM